MVCAVTEQLVLFPLCQQDVELCTFARTVYKYVILDKQEKLFQLK